MLSQTDPTLEPARRRLLIAAVVAVVALTFGVRLINPVYVETTEGIFLQDPDTVRRLLRFDHLGQITAPYPSADPRDGHPDGSAIHWTRPMDWVIQSLDAIVPAVHPRARPFESGAAWAGPVLATLAALAFLLLAIHWRGPAVGVAAGLLYALSTPLIAASSLGNGDHQNLQHLLVVIAVLGLLASIEGKAGPRIAMLSGACLGASLWVTTESMAVLVLLAVALGLHLLLLTPDERRAQRSRSLGWALACLAVCIVGDRVENPSASWTFEWDRISGFQILLAVVPVVFLLVLSRFDARFPRLGRLNPCIAGGASVVLVAALFLLAPSLGRQLTAQWESLQAANRWTQTCVREYGALLSMPFSSDLSTVFARSAFSLVFFVTPLLFVGMFLHRRFAWPARAPFAAVAIGFFGLTLYEIKLAHLFSILYPFVILLGGVSLVVLLRRSRPASPTGVPLAIVASLAVVLFLVAAPLERRTESDQGADLAATARRELVAELRRRNTKADDADRGDSERIAVLGTWELGAHLMYYCGTPVVASGYHRNLDGIRDVFRFFSRTSPEECRDILERRKVRWVVRQGDPAFLLQLGRAFPALGSMGAIDGTIHFDPRASATVWNVLSQNRRRWGSLTLVWRSSITARWFGAFPGPAFMLYEVGDR